MVRECHQPCSLSALMLPAGSTLFKTQLQRFLESGRARDTPVAKAATKRRFFKPVLCKISDWHVLKKQCGFRPGKQLQNSCFFFQASGKETRLVCKELENRGHGERFFPTAQTTLRLRNARLHFYCGSV